jgi:hypothetical protein
VPGPAWLPRSSTRGDLALTTDFRDIFAEVLAKRLGVRKLPAVFPGYTLNEKSRLGLID